jgi:FKBP-type peptidyl-prolyl cis-trans isomerase
MVKQVLVSIIVLCGVGVLAWFIMRADNNTSTDQSFVSPLPSATASSVSAAEQGNSRVLAGGLVVEDVVVGTGEEAVAGKTVSVHYTGKLTNGTVFDSSIPRGEPFKFVLGAGMVIKGWDQGVAGMKVGGKRKLTIPAPLAYGNQEVGGGKIPAGSTLVFDVELLAVER